ncbi:uncharacterized protein lcorl isoform X1 [Scleropages formosus]|uniref:uncharacterized protein lcorl isoform X1 n=1 Tax=Scleropages formosus TaxID=113540 RepID=UPI0010FAA343|nr:ligand-dependent nuclear receptor corepressor-like protein isoform X1 [Scleropages formosus]
MATQCRSSKCTAERKGFRRELDSWRHKLIHCVGFESILEGIYGPRLLRDLSIFDDCEPDVVNDWSVDASCSFCSLHLEKIGDHIPVVCSSPSSPVEETPQGKSNTEKIEYQADKFLHAIFRKKDLPQSRDPNIPLVAQELMKKMIRQFAIEYASKSQIQGVKNGSSQDADPVCDSLQHPCDQDGPLDLTVSRENLDADKDGVLDLSQKNRASFIMSACTTASSNQDTSGSLVQAGNEQVHLGMDEKLQVRTTVLEMVLSSLCSYHKMLLYHILKCVLEDFAISVTPYKDVHRHFSQSHSLSCHLDKKPHQDIFGFTDYQTSDGCYVDSCRLNTYSVAPVCICLKNFHCLPCQSVAIGCINKVIRSCGCYARPQQCPCSYQSFIESACIAPVGNVANLPFSPQKVCDSYNLCIRGCSPSPPPLSPIPSDASAKTCENNICSFAGGRCLNQPPSLFRHEEEGVAILHKEKCNKEEGFSTEEAERHAPDEDCTDCCTQTGRHFAHSQTGTLFQDLMEHINEKLKTMEPLEKQSLSLSASQSLTCSNDVRLGKILTILHKENDHDYNLKELHDLMENKSIETCYKRSQKTAINSSVLASSRRQSLQIKRELANFDSSPCRRKLILEEYGKKPAREEPNIHLPGTKVLQPTLGKGKDEMAEVSCDNHVSPFKVEPLHDLLENKQDEKNNGTKLECGTGNASSEKQIQPFKLSADLSRSRRNIVPPQRFSAYVTEPRKMYFAACFSESIFNKRAHKDTKVIGGNPSSELDINESSTELNLKGSYNKSQTGKQEAHDHSDKSSNGNVENSSRTRCSKLNRCVPGNEKSDDCEFKQSFQRRLKQREGASRSCVRLRSSVLKTQKHVDSQVDTVNFDNGSAEGMNTVEDALISNECQSVALYTSPIRLMFVSPVISGEEVKYSLKSAISGSSSQQTFDPCEESSWGGAAKSVVEEDGSSQVDTLKPRVTRGDENRPHKKAATFDFSRSSSPLNGEHETHKEMHGLTLTPPKRKPGRPKKLGPQVEKPAKRPIGRPPKHKTGSSSCVSNKGNHDTVTDFIASSCDEDDEKNKNLKITVVYGRSRRIRRLVSEGNGHFSKNQHVRGLQPECIDGCGVNADLNENMERSNTELSGKLPEEQTEKFTFVIPVKDKSHSSRNIKCAKQKCSAAMRKPGRPPKVKISGISVTVTTVSPKQRKIHMNKDMTELYGETSQNAEPLTSNHKICKELTTIKSQPCTADREKTENVQDGIMSQKIPVPLRHSLRVRKPSIHLLHSVATSRIFTRSNALLRRSRKLLLSKPSGESKQIKSHDKAIGETSDTAVSKTSSKNPCGEDLSFLSGISVDSIFTSNEPFRWWPTSASSDTLNEEFSRRVQLMSETWITEAVDSRKSFPTEREVNNKSKLHLKDTESAKKVFSPVRMLFQKHCNMDKLCAWFMQTTETQSLAIVKKANMRNPYEIVQYNPIRPSSRPNFCPSPQAERLRKHVKKFAKIVPISPAMHVQAQKRISRISKLKVTRRLFLGPSPVVRCFGQRPLLAKHKILGKYGYTLLRVKSKFTIRKKAHCNPTKPVQKVASSVTFHETCVMDTDPNSSNLPLSDGEKAQQVEKSKTDLHQKERISHKTLIPETLKDCKVFLKKINSPESKSTVEECNFCTAVYSDVSSSGHSLPPSKECEKNCTKKETTDMARIKRTKCSPRTLSPHSPKEQQQLCSRKQNAKRKILGASGSQTRKMTGQSRSRSQTAKRWCDFTPDLLKPFSVERAL